MSSRKETSKLASQIMAQIEQVSGLEHQLNELQRQVALTGGQYDERIEEVGYELECLEGTISAWQTVMLQDGSNQDKIQQAITCEHPEDLR